MNNIKGQGWFILELYTPDSQIEESISSVDVDIICSDKNNINVLEYNNLESDISNISLSKLNINTNDTLDNIINISNKYNTDINNNIKINPSINVVNNIYINNNSSINYENVKINAINEITNNIIKSIQRNIDI